METRIPCYKLGHQYVLGTFNPVLYYNCYVSIKDEAPFMHENNHAQICAGSPVHTFGARERLFELWPGSRANYSVVNEFEGLFEGIVKAHTHFNSDYRREEEQIVSYLETIHGWKLVSFKDLESDRISGEIIDFVEKVNKSRKFSDSRVCHQISDLLVNCTDPRSPIVKPSFDEAIKILKESISELQDFRFPIDLRWKAYEEIIKKERRREKANNKDIHVFEAHEIHADTWNALDFFHLCMEALMTAKNCLPAIESLSPLINFILPGYIYPFILVYLGDERYAVGIYTGAIEMRDVRKRVKKKYCILCSYLQELIDDVLNTSYKEFDKVQEIFECLWDFLIKAESLWIQGSNKCAYCGRTIRVFQGSSQQIQNAILKAPAICKTFFDKASRSYFEWFRTIAAIEGPTLLRQFRTT